MRHPDPMKPFIIDCDASVVGLGAALHQKDDQGKEYPVAFASRTLRPNEKKWTITELEALAVVWALETFRIYVEGTRTYVRTDHSPLLWLRNNVGKSIRLARWILRLQDFTFTLLHRSRAVNHVADALSRNPLPYDEQQTNAFDDTALAAFVGNTERCQSCWGQARIFLTRGGEGEREAGSPQGMSQTLSNYGAVRSRANDVVQMETRLPERESRVPAEIEIRPETMRECQKYCAETIALRQYVEGIPGAELPK